MQTLAKTFQNGKEEIARMWRFTRNNVITEGLHRKMKLIQRRDYGLRDFENYRLRVIAACGETSRSRTKSTACLNHQLAKQLSPNFVVDPA